MDMKLKICSVCKIEFMGKPYRSRCNACQKKYLKEWNEKNADRKRETQKAWNEKNAESIREYKRNYQKEHYQQWAKSRQKWRENNPEKVKEAGRQRDKKRLGERFRKEYMRRKRLKRDFDLSPETYEIMLKSQNYLCAICHKAETALARDKITLRRLAVDHDHLTGKIRQLLCNKCNCLLGRADDDIERLKAAITYLQKHRKE